MEEQKKLACKRKLNMKLYPIYKMLSTDVLFFLAVKVLFFTQVKHISNANVVLLETFYASFKMLMQIPMAVIVAKLGNRKSIIIGNIFWALELIIIMLSSNYIQLIISQLCSAIGWSCRSIAESPLLDASIPKTKNKSRIFTKIESKGYSKYCYISAITTIVSGFLYEINPYIPIVLAIIIILSELVISTNFIEMQENNKGNKNLKQSIIEVKEDFVFIVKSKRLKSLLLMIGFVWGVITLLATYQTTLLKDINVPAKYIGIILATLEICQGFSATKANNFNDKYKNKSLTFISLRNAVGIIIAGAVVILNIPRIPQLAIILLTYFVRMYDKGVFQILKKKYMGNFMTPEILTKVYSVYSIMCSIGRVVTTSIGSFLLGLMTIEYTMLVSGILFIVITLILERFIKTKVGLNPKEYNKNDIFV